MATSWDDHLNTSYQESYQTTPSYDDGYNSGGGGYGGGDYPPPPPQGYDLAPRSDWQASLNPAPMPGYERTQFEDGSYGWDPAYPDTSIPMPGGNYWYDHYNGIPPRFEDGSYDTYGYPEY
jgi:hypothetical protein